jgi:phospholipid N-methyltransferase
MRTFEFFRESLMNIKSVGTVTQSSRFLCLGMLKHVDFKKAKLIAELGAGDGVITRYILEKMPADCKLLCFEINPKFLVQLKAIKDDRLIVIEDSAEHLGNYIKSNGFEQVDYVVSALPFTLMSEELTYKIVRSCKSNLKLGGNFVQIHYSLSQRKVYRDIFGNLSINFVALNIPPAFVMVSENA